MTRTRAKRNLASVQKISTPEYDFFICSKNAPDIELGSLKKLVIAFKEEEAIISAIKKKSGLLARIIKRFRH